MAQRTSGIDRVVGFKIGFTNRSIWPLYNVHQPIFGPIYHSTVFELSQQSSCSLADLFEPRIEPEIVFRLSRTPQPGMTLAELLACTSHFCHAFEIVDSPFTDWRFTAEQAIQSGALHARLYTGPWKPIPQSPYASEALAQRLGDFFIQLNKLSEGIPTQLERASSSNVLDNPLIPLGLLAEQLQRTNFPRFLQEGDLISTGTITNAYPVQAGETFSTQVTNLTWCNDRSTVDSITGITLSFTD